MASDSDPDPDLDKYPKIKIPVPKIKIKQIKLSDIPDLTNPNYHQVMNIVIKYLAEYHLQDPHQRTKILLDETIKKVFADYLKPDQGLINIQELPSLIRNYCLQ